MKQLREDHPEEGKQLMELMPAWKRWGYIEGMEQGIEQGIEQGVEKGKIEIAQQLLAKGFSLNEVCELTGLHLELLEKLPKK